MFRNFILLAYRHFVRSPLSSFIELFGMTAGLTVFLLILLWVFHENSFDKFNKKADRIYRVEWTTPSSPLMAINPSIIGSILTQNLPEIEKAVRFFYNNSSHEVYRINDQNTKDYFAAEAELFADNEFFDMFTFDFIAGNPTTALAEKNTVVITESLAKIIFGDVNPIGEQLFSEDNRVLTITGVIKDEPSFHIPFKIIRSFLSLETGFIGIPDEDPLNSWNGFEHPTYILINSQQDSGQLEKKISDLIELHRPELSYDNKIQKKYFYLKPLKDIYFNGGSAVERGYSRHGDRKKVMAYTSIAIFTLLLACINFINLNSAKSFERAKEVGIKKVSGASRANVFIQFLGEVVILCIISLILALVFTHSVLPWFNDLMNSSLSMGQLLNPWLFASMIFGLLIISLASGGIPALYMSSFQPVMAIKGLPTNSGKGFNFKKLNLAIQFVVTTILLIGTMTIFRQINYMKNAELGFGKEHRVIFSFDGRQFRNEVDVLKNVLLSNTGVINVSNTSAVPGRNTVPDDNVGVINYEGNEYSLTRTTVDEGYLKTLDLELVEGRFFEKDRFLDNYHFGGNNPNKNYRILLNETAVKTIGLEHPIGAKLKFERLGRNLEVIGVLKDFHLNSLNSPIIPMYFSCFRKSNQIIANISSTDMASTILFIESEIENITGNKPSITFLDDEFDRQYNSDDKFAELVGYFAALAILIACMGLLGVATHAIKLRIKEIGIRKIMGASPFQILSLLMGSFIKIVILSAVLAVPIAWFIMEGWLDNYAYRTDMNWWVFAFGCGLTVFIAMSTIIWQSWKASSQNPARLIRYE